MLVILSKLNYFLISFIHFELKIIFYVLFNILGENRVEFINVKFHDMGFFRKANCSELIEAILWIDYFLAEKVLWTNFVKCKSIKSIYLPIIIIILQTQRKPFSNLNLPFIHYKYLSTSFTLLSDQLLFSKSQAL